jgi:tetratricopeptide (TPR) repeat protein
MVQTEIKKQTNLTVEDIELGKLLNQINLKCDSSDFTDTISYYDGMGPALYRLCKFDSSLNFFNESLIDNPNDVEILVNKGSTLGKLGYFSEAILYYDQAINIEPNFLPAKNNKANALANLGNTDDAISLYNEILTKNSHYITARKNLEIILSETSQIHNVVDTVDKFENKNTVNHKSSLSEKTIFFDSKKQKPTNFFEEVSLVFSSLGSLFGFLN